MNRNTIARKRAWTCMVLMLASVFSVVAQVELKGVDTERNSEEPAPEAHSVEVARRVRVAEVTPAINLVNISTNKKSLALGVLSNIVKEKAFGVQLGGLYNHIGGMGRGVAIAGLGNTVLGSYCGMQIGGLSNYNADGSIGLMIGGLSNIVGGGVDGMQLAGLGNIAKDTEGVQLAGLVNISQDTYGLQLSGVANIAEDVYGLQLAGLVNVAKRVKGVQFASVLNVAEESDFPIGLVNIVKNGCMGVALTYDIVGNMLVSFRSGGRYAYGIVGVGCNRQLVDRVVAEAGYGIHIPICKWLQVNNEVKATAPINTSSVNFAYLLAPSVTLWDHCNLFGGASVNYLMANTASTFMPKHELWQKQSADGVHRLYIGFQVGVQYVF